MRSFELDHTEMGHTVMIGGTSYLWGALFGPLYVLLKGFVGEALIMLAVSLGIALVASLGFIVTASVNFRAGSVIVMILIPPAALFIQGIVAVHLTRLGYLRRGWRDGQR